MTDPSKVRLCSACQKNRPARTFRWFRASVGGYHIEVEVCDYCKEGLVHAIISYGVRASDLKGGDEELTKIDHRIAMVEAQLAEAREAKRQARLLLSDCIRPMQAAHAAITIAITDEDGLDGTAGEDVLCSLGAVTNNARNLVGSEWASKAPELAPGEARSK